MIRLGPISDIPPGEGRAYPVGDTQVAVFRLRDGSVRALSAICPHRGGPIADGQIDLKVVVCPLHLTAFDLTTGCSNGDVLPLTVYAVRVDDADQLILEDLS